MLVLVERERERERDEKLSTLLRFSRVNLSDFINKFNEIFSDNNKKKTPGLLPGFLHWL
jgi:hypothetical protein